MESVVRKALEEGKTINSLDELMVIIKSQGVAKSWDGKVTDRRDNWEKIFEEANTVPSHKEWSVEEETALAKLEAKSILIKETEISHLKKQQKQELLVTFNTLSPETLVMWHR